MKNIQTVSPKAEVSSDEILVKTFARIDSLALGLATGITAGIGLFLATALLLLKGGSQVGQNLSLLSHYLPGFSVTWPGALIGGVDASIIGFLTGWGMAFLRNALLSTYVYLSAFWTRLDRFLDDA